MLAGVGVALVAGAGLAVALQLGAATGGGAEEPPAAARTATAVVERGDLALTARLDGSIGFGAAAPLTSKASGTITWLPAVGDRLERGAVALRADERAVPVLIGSIPLYRDIVGWGMEGADVDMVAENLMELGFLERSDAAGYRTDAAFRAAVRDWQQSLGLERTGDLGPAAAVVLGKPGRVATVSAKLGDAAGGEPLAVTAATRVVEASVPASDAGAIAAGAEATIELPDGRTTAGTITSVTTSGEGPDAKVGAVVAIADQSAVEGIDAAAVTVRVATRSVEDVLIVPVAALLALAEGGYALQDEQGGLHAVELGLVADDRVEVSGDGIEAGMTVVTAR